MLTSLITSGLVSTLEQAESVLVSSSLDKSVNDVGTNLLVHGHINNETTA